MTALLSSHSTEAGPLLAMLRTMALSFKKSFYFLYGADHNMVGSHILPWRLREQRKLMTKEKNEWNNTQREGELRFSKSWDSYFQYPLAPSSLEFWEFPWILLKSLESLHPSVIHPLYFCILKASYDWFQIPAESWGGHYLRLGLHSFKVWKNMLTRRRLFTLPTEVTLKIRVWPLFCLIQQSQFPYRVLHISFNSLCDWLDCSC